MFLVIEDDEASKLIALEKAMIASKFGGDWENPYFSYKKNN